MAGYAEARGCRDGTLADAAPYAGSCAILAGTTPMLQANFLEWQVFNMQQERMGDTEVI